MIKRFLLFFIFCLLSSFCYATTSDFNGTTSIVTVTQQAAINSDVFTMGCWTYRESDGEGSVGTIFDKSNATIANGWHLQIASSLYNFRTAWTTTDGIWTIPESTVNTWSHIAVSYNFGSTANDPTIYVDGVEQSETEVNNPNGTELNDIDDLDIGNRTGADRTWDGKLADCFFYNRILTANEIKQIMRWGPQSLKNGLIGYWPLGAFTGNNYTSTTNLNGTPTGLTVSNIGPPVNSPQGGK